MKIENMTYRRTKYQLAQDAEGFWGWAVGRHVMVAYFAYRSTAIKSAQRFIDSL